MGILVFGNGSTGIDKGHYFVNKHTGNFLAKINEKYPVSFCQPTKKNELNEDLLNYDISNIGIRHIDLDGIINVGSLTKIFIEIIKSDFVYLFFPGSLSRIAAILCIITSKSFGIYLRGQYFNKYKFDKAIISRAKFILTVSPSFRDSILQSNSRISIIKPMIELTLNDLYTEEKMINYNFFNILFVGRVEERKGILDLLKIALLLDAKGLSFHMKIIGGGDMFGQCKKEIDENGLNGKVMLVGQISDKEKMSHYYQNADVFIFTSHDEGFPRVLYEAMAYKLMIFTTFVGGIPGRMIDGNNCIEIPAKNPELASQIIFDGLMNNIEKLKTLAENGQSTVKNILLGDENRHEDQFIVEYERSFK